MVEKLVESWLPVNSTEWSSVIRKSKGLRELETVNKSAKHNHQRLDSEQHSSIETRSISHEAKGLAKRAAM